MQSILTGRRPAPMYAALAAALILAFWLRALLPVSDIDLWWHLAMGASIVEQRALPMVDPLGVWQDASSLPAQIVLRGQWLGQVALNAAWELGGIAAIGVLRATLMASALLGVVGIARVRGGSGGSGESGGFLALLAVGALAFLEFSGERPQLFSFVFAVLLWGSLEIIRRSERLLILLLPPALTLLWVQFHGAAFLAPVLCLVSAAGCWLHERNSRVPRRSHALLLVAVGCGAALALGPNGLATYQYLLQTFVTKSAEAQTLSEYSRPWSLGLFSAGAWAYWGLLALAVIGLPVLLSRRAWHDALALGFFAAFSLLAWRNVAFFVLLSPPILAAAATEMILSRRREEASSSLAPWPAWVALPAIAAWWGWVAVQPPKLRPEIATDRFPVGLIAEASRAGLKGRAFTTLAWGGYVGWASRGAVVPFIDGRLLEAARLEPYKHMLWATPAGLAMFDRAGFDLAIVPRHGNFSAEPYPLPRALLARGWTLIAADGNGFLLARRGHSN